MEGLSFGLGVYGATERQPSIDNVDWTLPGYVRLDAMAAYQIDRWTLQLNVKKSLMKRYMICHPRRSAGAAPDGDADTQVCALVKPHETAINHSSS